MTATQTPRYYSVRGFQPGEDPEPVNLALTHGRSALAITVTDLLGANQAAIQLNGNDARALAAKLVEFADRVDPEGA